ncbi:hypothetical protein SLS57_010880 [Botryosphaeria dothidea]
MIAKIDENTHIPPTIDIAPSFSGDLAARKAVASQIHEASHNLGYFYVVGHGIPDEVCSQLLGQVKRFFTELSDEQKLALKGVGGYGYETTGYTSAQGEPETKQAFNLGYEERLDELVTPDNKPRRTFGGNAWPQEQDLPGFFDGVKSYFSKVVHLHLHLVRLYALGLGLPENYFDEFVTNRQVSARLMQYPRSKNPAPFDPERDNEQIGMGAHSDYQTLTINHASAGGLEILSKEGRWLQVPRQEGALIVNPGDFFQRITNDKYQSTMHRVVNRTAEERYSMPVFFSFDYDRPVPTTTRAGAERNIMRKAGWLPNEPEEKETEEQRLFRESKARKLKAIEAIMGLTDEN